MTLTFFTLTPFFHPIKQWIHQLYHRRPAPPASNRSRSGSRRNTAPELIADCAVFTRAKCTNAPAVKPLRVVRVIEPGHTQASVGRMVISGRMADVCAELDRLVAREAMAS